VFLDFAIVVVGVVIGMQVSNWNEAHADKRLGRAYVVRLTRDIEQDLVAVRAEIAY
jgi:hypothetical protein